MKLKSKLDVDFGLHFIDFYEYQSNKIDTKIVVKLMLLTKVRNMGWIHKLNTMETERGERRE